MTTDVDKTHQLYHPSLRDMLMLSRPSDVRISPDGARLAFTVQVTNWQDDCYESACVIHDLDSGLTTPLTRTGSVSQMAWVDDRTLAVLRRTDGGESQVWLYERLVGEGWQVTRHKGGVQWFEPFAGGILFLADDPERNEQKERKDRFGQFTHFEQEPSASALYYVGLAHLRAYEAQARASTEDEAKKLVQPVIELSRLFPEPLSIQTVVPSRTGDAIYLTCRSHDDLVYYRETSSFRISLDAQAALNEYLRRQMEKQASKDGPAAQEGGDEAEKSEDTAYLGTLTRLAMPNGASIAGVSPDGKKLMVVHQGRDLKMYTRQDVWIVDAEAALAAQDAEAFTAAMRNLTASLDRSTIDGGWFECGILVLYADGTVLRAARLDEDGTVHPIDLGEIHPTNSLHASDGGRLAFVGAGAQTISEVYVADLPPAGASLGIGGGRTSSSSQNHLGHRLRHGVGRTGTWAPWRPSAGRAAMAPSSRACSASRRTSTHLAAIPWSWSCTAGRSGSRLRYLLAGEDLRTYPSVQFMARDVLVLKPNYRGSIGRGQAFAELNVNNLGRRRPLGYRERRRSPGGARLCGSGPCRLHGLVAGRLHLGLRGPALRQVPRGLRRGRHLRLVHLSHQQRHPRLHPRLPLGVTLPGSRALRQDRAHRQSRQRPDADADPARER